MEQQPEDPKSKVNPHFKGSAFWDERYAGEEYVYGENPNAFFQYHLDQWNPGQLLLVAEGEGRNAVYAAQHGWKVDALDFSRTAKEKAEKLASARGVSINYYLSDVTSFSTDKKYDLIVFLFLHLGPDDRKTAFRRYLSFLNPGGRILVEVFSPDQLGKSSGGPQHPDYLISKDELEETFGDLEILQLEEVTTELKEGRHHSGEAHTCRLVAKKLS